MRLKLSALVVAAGLAVLGASAQAAPAAVNQFGAAPSGIVHVQMERRMMHRRMERRMMRRHMERRMMRRRMHRM